MNPALPAGAGHIRRGWMKDAEILNIFRDSGALLDGHFMLSSGLHSSQYLQCAIILQDPKYAEKLCSGLASKFRRDNITVVIGPALGGVVVSYAVARALGARSMFTERINGRMALRRGFKLHKKDRALIVEDVITTGASTKEVIDIVKKSGACLIGIGSLADRTKGIYFGEKFVSLLKIDIPAFAPSDCPLCKEKMPLIKPGSKGR